MVLIEIKDDIAIFACAECGRIITTGQNFLVNPKNIMMKNERKNIYHISLKLLLVPVVL